MANEYSNLLAGAPSQSLKMQAMVEALTEPLQEARERLSGLKKSFDVDYAVGDQLDAVGARVGVSRDLPMAILDVYFAFDMEGVGFDYGTFQGEYDPKEGLQSLGDETYRQIIKAKVLANHWDGSREGLEKVLEGINEIFGVRVIIEDLHDMRLVVRLRKDTTPPLIWELFTRRLIDITPVGVGWHVLDALPWFAFDLSTGGVNGFDAGYFYDWEAVNG